MVKTDFKGLGKALADINKKIAKMEDIATTRTLNIVLKNERKEIVDDVSKEYGVLKRSARKNIDLKKATRTNKEIGLNIHSARSNLVQPKRIKGGISFRKGGGGRVKVKTSIKPGSSKPFMIKARAGGQPGSDDIIVRGSAKKVPVYVSKLSNKFKTIAKRKVTTLKGSSLARMAEKLEVESGDLERRLRDEFPGIYKKQLEKAKFTGSK